MTDDHPRIRECHVSATPGSDLIELTMIVGSSPVAVSRSISPELAFEVALSLYRAAAIAGPPLPGISE